MRLVLAVEKCGGVQYAGWSGEIWRLVWFAGAAEKFAVGGCFGFDWVRDIG